MLSPGFDRYRDYRSVLAGNRQALEDGQALEQLIVVSGQLLFHGIGFLRRGLLAIEGFQSRVVEMAGEIGLVNRDAVITVIAKLGGLDLDVGQDAFALDRASAGGVVTRRGQSQRGAVRQRHNGLHRALAEGARAENQRAMIVLERAGNDFRSGG